MLRGVSTLAVALVLALLSAPSPEVEPRTVVLVRAGSATALVERVEEELAAMLLHRPLRGALTSDGPSRRAAAEVLSRCGSDLACSRKALAAAALDVVCVVDVDLTESLATVTVLDAERGLWGARTLRLAYTDDRSILEQVLPAARQLFDERGLPALARLVVRTVPQEAVVTVVGSAADPHEPSAWRGPGGVAEISVTAPGYQPHARAVTLRPDHTLEVVVTLEPEDTLWSTPWPWVAIGAAAAAAVAGVVVASQLGGTCGCLELVEGSCGGCAP